MFDELVRKVMQRRKFLEAKPGTFVSRAAELMAAKKVGVVIVVEDDRLSGIFTERDALFRVLARRRDPHTTRLADVMTRELQTVGPDKPFGYALLMMYEKGVRYLPVVEEGKPIGIISSRNAMDPEMEEFAFEASRRKRFGEIRWAAPS